jgi:eukaryotic-like serine/threonine-protein kinase
MNPRQNLRHGQLLFVHQNILFAQPFDAARLELSGEPVRLAENIPTGSAQSAFSISDSVLAYRSTATDAQTSLQLGWFDRSGKLLEKVGPPGTYVGPSVSPDGKRIAVHRHEAPGGDIWIIESSNGPIPRFTFEPAQENSNPVWSGDGRWIAFASLRNGKWGIYRKPANLTGAEELLTESETPRFPLSWSPDGNFIVFGTIDPQTQQDLWLLPPTGDRKPAPLMNTPFIERDGQISPDGKWLAYASDETGQREIYIRPFPNGEGKYQVSTGGGTYPRWRRDGKELFYFISVLNPKLMSVTINPSGATVQSGTPQELFDTKSVTQMAGHQLSWLPYDISADGQRFLIARSAENLSGDTATIPISVVLNWKRLLKRK